ncbi:hypothetical protein [Citrobacter sp. NCU1]|uniref:hypothetical protein n=1 Tax=Citrobacter sp. NCU1 TaxID=2026683 RepID=UPI00187870C1|nr:hypothetical protein [Citrobacter sp. NCU1]
MNLAERFTSTSFKNQLTWLVLTSLTITLVIFFSFKKLGIFDNGFYDFYAKNLRGYFFSGFISVGSFLLSLHTFVIVNLKDKLFSSDHYRERYAKSRQIKVGEINEKDILKPLDRLSCFINISIWLSISTAIAQFTLGLAPYTLISISCIWLGLLTILFMLNSLVLIRLNIKDMLHQN